MRGNKQLERFMFKGAYCFLFLYAFFGHIQIFAEPLKVFSNFSLVLIFLSFLYNARHNLKKTLFKIIPLLLISSIFIFTSNSFVPFKIVLLLISSGCINFKERIKFDLKLRVIFTIVMFILLGIGIASDNIALIEGGNEMTKHSLGFANANVLGLDILILCMEIIYLGGKEKVYLNSAVSAAIMLASYNWSGSRSSLATLIIFIILCIIYKIRERIFNSRALKYIIVLSPIIISLIVAILYFVTDTHTELRTQIDAATSGRITNMRIFAQNFEISVFGSDLTVAERTCDVATIYIIYSFGIFGLAMFFMAFMKLMKRLYDKKQIMLCLVFLSFLVYGLSEKLWIYVDYNIFMTAFTFLLFSENKNNKGTTSVYA